MTAPRTKPKPFRMAVGGRDDSYLLKVTYGTAANDGRPVALLPGLQVIRDPDRLERFATDLLETATWMRENGQ